MKILFEISIYELVIALATVIAGTFALFQWRQSYQLKRAELVKEASCKVREDGDIVSVLYSIDYSEDWYNDAFLTNHEIESKYDKAFAYFDYICYLRFKGIITKDEFRIFEYRIQRMAYNYSFRTYFFNLYHFSVRMGRDISFYYLLNYLKDNKLIEADFWDVNSHKYPHMLNI